MFYTIEDLDGDSSAVLIGSQEPAHFAKGVIESKIVLNLNTDALGSGARFKVTLSSTSRNNVSIINTNPEIISEVIVCVRPLVIHANYTGKTYVVDTIDAAPDYLADMTANLIDNGNGTYTFSNGAWGPGTVPALTGNPANANYIYPATITFSPSGKVVVDGTESYTTEGNLGSVNPCNGEITYFLEQGLFSDPFLIKVVLTPGI